MSIWGGRTLQTVCHGNIITLCVMYYLNAIYSGLKHGEIMKISPNGGGYAGPDVFRVTLRRNVGNTDLGGVTHILLVRVMPELLPVSPISARLLII